MHDQKKKSHARTATKVWPPERIHLIPKTHQLGSGCICWFSRIFFSCDRWNCLSRETDNYSAPSLNILKAAQFGMLQF